MTPELGQGGLLVALALALWGSAAAASGGRTGRGALVESAQHAAIGVFALVTGAFALLVVAFLRFDFSVRYVATNTNLGTPFWYRITGVWGALEGSIVLWAWMLSLYTLIVIARHRMRSRDLYPWVLSVMLAIMAFFLLVMTIAAPPFQRLAPVPADGRGLNPLLEDTGMITHPIALYLGFTGFTVPFAFAMAALITGRVSDAWLAATRRWTITAWYFLSLGLLIGGWWSYHVLGWGGYWAWDPVENAAFMPWLTGTAFLHSVMIQERRRMLKLWNIALVILTFSLTLFGTFLTRSGVIASVHAFTQGSIGIFFLTFLSLVVLVALGLLAFRWKDLEAQGQLDSVLSRESAFLLNNVLFVAAAFTVFFGTVFPLLAEAVRGTKVSVGAPFFNQVNIPLFLSLIFLMGIGPLIAWRRASPDNLRRNFLVPVVLGVAGAALFFFAGVRSALAVLCLALTVFVAATIGLDLVRATRSRARLGETVVPALGRLLLAHNRRYGGFIVHFGILIIAIGVTGSQAWSIQRETTLQRGETTELGGYRIRFDGLDARRESNHEAVLGTFTVTRGAGRAVTMQPAKKFYPQEQSPIAGVDYRLGLREDVYLVLGDFAQDGSHATIKVQVNRLVSWIWIGGAVLTLGAALALLPERRRATA
ncbi:MAG: heme lyase CcmF/NrfE family subunit [Candidatus Rokubacteria bacterium]|nr:heme lyase CcmF/NrfE family subunit [Candidatus Rokubacteria bacterium]MBI3826203.1 heme lyase CcmF/NrfE family subunit [Candidatus Rokubacteria bacterium]